MKQARQMELPDPVAIYKSQRRTAIAFLHYEPATSFIAARMLAMGDTLSHARDWWAMAKGTWRLHAEATPELRHVDDDPQLPRIDAWCICPECTEREYPILKPEE